MSAEKNPVDNLSEQLLEDEKLCIGDEDLLQRELTKYRHGDEVAERVASVAMSATTRSPSYCNYFSRNPGAY